MSELERYVNEVLHNIHAPAPERERIEADLRAHLEEAARAGQPPRAILEHMGSPAEVAAEFMSQVPLRYAGFWPRLAAFLLDLLFLFPLAVVLGGVGQFFINLVPRHDLATLDYILGALWIALSASAILGVIGLFLIYFPVLEGRFGQTLGKRLMGLVVLKETGLPIGYKEALLRRIPFYFDFVALDALFIPFTAKKQRAFDIIARTIVVREGEPRAARAAAAGALALLGVLLSAFALYQLPFNVEWMAVGRRGPGELSKSYAYFRGIERATIQAREGQVITVGMQASVRNGWLELKMIDPAGRLVGGTTVPAGLQGDVLTEEFHRVETGRYTVQVEGHDTGGSFDVTWKVE